MQNTLTKQGTGGTPKAGSEKWLSEPVLFRMFRGQLLDGVRARVGEGVTVNLLSVMKNNNTMLNALQFNRKGSNVGVVIYYDDHYRDFLAGKKMGGIVSVICEEYRAAEERLPDRAGEKAEMIRCFRAVKERIVYTLIGAGTNEELLKGIPHIRVLDMAAVFSVLLPDGNGANMSIRVTNELMDRWGTGDSEVPAAAVRNTPALLPPTFRSMRDTLLGMLAGQTDEDDKKRLTVQIMQEKEEPMYVLTNRECMNGAGAILYRDELKRCADSLGSSLVILPSSIHEMIILQKKEDTDLDMLRRMVRDINLSEVREQDRLTDSVYVYERADNSIRLAGSDRILYLDDFYEGRGRNRYTVRE